ncbi:hypothetical protein WJX72_007054 [[Myrmecia] bisecta]|uniref:Ankyrin repeat protein n=1 Tax=[Myrmecia] bisecta TaxID=41462 RepID=A0AAW1R7V2_9CHLO
MVDALLAKGADVNARNAKGWTAMHAAADAHSVSLAVIAALLGHGAEVDAFDDWGTTPLHVAAKAGKADVVSVLLQSQKSVVIIFAMGLPCLVVKG